MKRRRINRNAERRENERCGDGKIGALPARHSGLARIPRVTAAVSSSSYLQLLVKGNGRTLDDVYSRTVLAFEILDIVSANREFQRPSRTITFSSRIRRIT
jgi:hypothetical protein